MKYSVIIPCAGKGTRLNLGYNKIFYKVNDQTIIEKTLTYFLKDSDCKQIIIVFASNDYAKIKELFHDKRISYVMGGETRQESVFNGLSFVKENYVLIHDGDRCNVSKDLIETIKAKLDKKSLNIVPFINKNDAISISGREVEDKLIQTPQGFAKGILIDAYIKCANESKLKEFSDDASIVETYTKYKTEYVLGDINNIKITTSEDLKYLKETK